MIVAPYLTRAGDLAGSLPSQPQKPVALYRRDRTTFHYVCADLLHPEAFGEPGAFVEAVVSDIWAAGEGDGRRIESLTWFIRTWSAIAGAPRPVSQRDVAIAESYRAAIGGAPRLRRGEALLFVLPTDSSWRKRSGLRAVVAIATRPPSEGATDDGTPLLFPQGLGKAFGAIRGAGVRSVGVPRMVARTTIADRGSRADSWHMILRESDDKARSAGLRAVLFGGWGIDPRGRSATDAAFRNTWEQRRLELLAETRVFTHERLRLGALIAFAALARWIWKKRPLRWLRLVALVIVAAGLAVSIAAAGRWAWSFVDAPAWLVFAAECALALAAGTAIEWVVQFDPKKLISDPARETG
ncbi:MAG TPA: hypothetical protein VNI54_14150 [Thermoanaerobaculia bacterium]|nr:hypothetical protein [Thermoanaerobaculia bacterium]